jgi:hypothetical protein
MFLNRLLSIAFLLLASLTGCSESDPWLMDERLFGKWEIVPERGSPYAQYQLNFQETGEFSFEGLYRGATKEVTDSGKGFWKIVGLPDGKDVALSLMLLKPSQAYLFNKENRPGTDEWVEWVNPIVVHVDVDRIEVLSWPFGMDWRAQVQRRYGSAVNAGVATVLSDPGADTRVDPAKVEQLLRRSSEAIHKNMEEKLGFVTIDYELRGATFVRSTLGQGPTSDTDSSAEKEGPGSN